MLFRSVQWSTDAAFSAAATDEMTDSVAALTSETTHNSEAVYEYTIPAMAQGTTYYLRVAAINDVGQGPYQATTPPTQIPRTATVAISANAVVLQTIQADAMTPVKEAAHSLRVLWEPPRDERGDAVSQYEVEWWFDAATEGDAARDGQVGTPEVQIFELLGQGGADLGGTFQVGWADQWTDHMDAATLSAEGLRKELEGLPSVQSVFVEQLLQSTSQHYYKVTFTGDAGNLPYTLEGNVERLLPASSTFSATVPAAWSADAQEGALPASYDSAVVTDLSASSPHNLGGSFQYIIKQSQGVPLTTGTSYSVRVTPYNDMGRGPATYSTPASLAPPFQKASVPTNVQLVTNTGTQLKLIWNAPASDGGSEVTKYKVEWDASPGFDSLEGQPSFYHEFITTSAGDCAASPCFYVMRSLEQGTPYYARIYAYNTYGYSDDFARSSPEAAAPTSRPGKPSAVSVAPASATALTVAWSEPENGGGAPVTKYWLQWDAEDASGVLDGATSALYNVHEVQSILTHADDNTVGGTFRVQFGATATATLDHAISANGLKAALQTLPDVGEVDVTRSQNVDGFGHRWDVTFAGQQGNVAAMEVSTHDDAIFTKSTTLPGSGAFASDSRATATCSAADGNTVSCVMVSKEIGRAHV